MNQTIQLKKNLSTFSLMMTGISSMVGSGWLLATQKIANIAGPIGIISWVVGMIVAILIACFCIEIGTIFPSAGGIGYYSKVTHGRFSGFLTQWINWISIMPVPAVEAQAIVQYLSQVSPVCHTWYDPQLSVLTSVGIFYAIIFMLFFMFINYWGVKLFIRFNNILTILKMIVPILTIACIIYIGLHPSNFGSIYHEFAPNGISAVGTAVISCGVVMSFNGFQTPLNFSEEIKSPRSQLPIAIIGGILFTFILYVLLQIVFIGAINPNDLKNGWQFVHLRSPYVNLLLAANLQLMAWIVMTSATIAPAACGAAFLASSTRIIYNVSRQKFISQYFGVLDPKYTTPRRSIILNTIIGCLFLFFFRGWSDLVAVISVFHVFSYLSMPIVVIAFRRLIFNKSNNAFRLPFAYVLAPLSVYILSILLFYAGWLNIVYFIVLCLLGILFFFYYEISEKKHLNILEILKSGVWFLYFTMGITIIAYLGNQKDATNNIISTKTSFILLFLLSLSSFYIGIITSQKKLSDESEAIYDFERC